MSVCVSVHPSILVFTLSNMNISESSGGITIKFYLKHHCGGEKLHKVLGQIRSELFFSMATESSHRFIMWENVLPHFLGCF